MNHGLLHFLLFSISYILVETFSLQRAVPVYPLQGKLEFEGHVPRKENSSTALLSLLCPSTLYKVISLLSFKATQIYLMTISIIRVHFTLLVYPCQTPTSPTLDQQRAFHELNDYRARLFITNVSHSLIFSKNGIQTDSYIEM